MLGTIAAARAFCANSQGDTQSAADYAHCALELLPDCSSISRSIRSVATSILGDASWINGDLEKAARAYVEAIRIGRDADNSHMVVIANTNLADVLMEQGNLHQAHGTYIQALQIAVRPDGQKSPLARSLYAGLGRASYESNELNEAVQYMHQCIDLCQQWGDMGLQAVAWSMLARLKQARGYPEEAQAAVQNAERLTVGQPLSSWQSIQTKSSLGCYWLSQGALDRVFQLIRKSGLAIDDKIPYRRMPEYILLLRTLMAKGDYEAALTLSKRLLQQAETAGRVGSVIEILILRALAFQGMKDTEHSLLALERALALAQPEGYIRLFLDEGEAMTRLLCQAQSRQVGSGYAAELLSKIGGVPGMAQPSMQLLIEPLTAREVEVLKFIEAGCSNQEIAEKLVISNATVKRHISNIYAKLGVKSRTQAVAIGKEFKIFE
jgi:LuxR family maltose regulon positive regulatory protein